MPKYEEIKRDNTPVKEGRKYINENFIPFSANGMEIAVRQDSPHYEECIKKMLEKDEDVEILNRDIDRLAKEECSQNHLSFFKANLHVKKHLVELITYGYSFDDYEKLLNSREFVRKSLQLLHPETKKITLRAFKNLKPLKAENKIFKGV